jgi:outer membrane protein assembly factor BamB
MGKFGNETKLIAVGLSDGKILWSTPVGTGGDSPNCTPTADGELVYAISFAGDLLCARADNGEEVWRKNFGADFGGKMMSGWGYSESPLVDGDRLIVTPGAADAMLVALNKKTGDTIWKSAITVKPGPAGRDGAGYSSVVISQGAGLKQYVQLVGRGVIGVDAETGQLLWGYNKIANGTANVPTPIVSGDYVFCSSGYGDGGSALLKIIRSRNQVTAQEIWYKNNKELQNHHGGMVLIGEHVYMGHGHNNGFPICFDMLSGRDMWRPGRGVGGGSAAVVAADGHLYFRYEDGKMALIEATPTKYNLKSSFQIPINHGKSWAHPVVAQGKLFLRDQHEMLCLDVSKP